MQKERPECCNKIFSAGRPLDMFRGKCHSMLRVLAWEKKNMEVVEKSIKSDEILVIRVKNVVILQSMNTIH